MRILSTFLRIAIGTLLALLAFEILLRHLSWSSSISESGHGSTEIYRLLEGWGVSHWDSRGIRVTPPKAGPVLLVVGDSYTESGHVDDDDVYTSRLQSLLGIKVLNDGLSTLSPADYLLAAPEVQTRFRPSWTIIELNAPDLSDDGFIDSKAHFLWREGKLVPTLAPQAKLGRISRLLARLRRRSALMNYGIARGTMFRALAQMPPLFRAADEAAPKPATPHPAFTPPVENELSLMTAAYGGRLTFLFIPEFNKEADVVEKRFLAHCAAARLSCVDLRVAFDDFRTRGRAPFGFPNSYFGQGHMNADGHRAAADLLAHELSSLRRRGLF